MAADIRLITFSDITDEYLQLLYKKLFKENSHKEQSCERKQSQWTKEMRGRLVFVHLPFRPLAEGCKACSTPQLRPASPGVPWAQPEHVGPRMSSFWAAKVSESSCFHLIRGAFSCKHMNAQLWVDIFRIQTLTFTHFLFFYFNLNYVYVHLRLTSSHRHLKQPW